jgi:hypothetical protein
VLDLIRLAEDRWLARAATARPDGTPVSIEEVLVCEGMPNVEVVIDVRGDHSFLVLRERHDPEHVLVERPISPETPPLRVVWDASQWDVARAQPISVKPISVKPISPAGGPVPA